MWQLGSLFLFPLLAILLGVALERLLRSLRLRWIGSVLVALVLVAASIIWSLLGLREGWEPLSFDGLKFLLPAALSLLMLSCPRWVKKIVDGGLDPEVMAPQVARFYRCFYSSALLMLLPAATPLASQLLDLSDNALWLAGLSFWLLAVSLQLLALNRMREIRLLCHKIVQALNTSHNLNSESWLSWVQEEFSLSASFNRQVFHYYTGQMQEQGRVVTMELDNSQWVFASSFYNERMARFESLTAQRLYSSDEDLQLAFRQCFSLPESTRDLSLDRYCVLVRRLMQQEPVQVA